MKYIISITQKGGTRPYPAGTFEMDDQLVRPMMTLEALGYIHGIAETLAANICRVSGYHYINAIIPEGSVGAEIGVDHGDGLVRMLASGAKKIYAVDPWVPTNDEDPWTDVPQELMDQRYEMVLQRFQGDERVSILRQTSDQFFDDLPDGHLDWVYIDGDHHENQVKRDLANAFSKVRVGGFIMGDDLWTTHWRDDIKAAFDWFKEQYPVSVVWERSDPFVVIKTSDERE